MKHAFLSIAAVFCVAMTGCSQSAGPFVTPSRPLAADHEAFSATARAASGCPCYRVLFSFSGSFTGGTDGAFPTGDLTYANGSFYGMTYAGGGPGNFGSVYGVTPTGAERVLYAFQATPDGNHPMGNGLAYANGALFGTTYDGGANDRGTFFSLTPGGNEQVVYSFQKTAGPARPQSSLVDVGGAFYGVAANGGKYKAGAIFSISAAGKLTVLHDFGGTSNHDGANPIGGLIAAGGALYGTTQAGGTANMGTVYKVTLSGAETVLHSFAGGADGAAPWYPPVYLHGRFYGTTSGFGTSSGGTIYSITAAGAEKVLHTFERNTFGPASPHSGLVVMNGQLYGTTNEGGAFGLGTIFRTTPEGVVQVLHAFAGHPSDGETPGESNLYPLDGVLYGTAYGGTNDDGAFFSLRP